jgi:hypothetical protein
MACAICNSDDNIFPDFFHPIKVAANNILRFIEKISNGQPALSSNGSDSLPDLSP